MRFTEVFERWTGVKLPFSLPPACVALATETRDGEPWEILVGRQGDPRSSFLRELQVGPWILSESGYGEFRMGFTSTGMHSEFVLVDLAKDRTVSVRYPFGGMFATPESNAKEQDAVIRLVNAYAIMTTKHLGKDVKHLHATDHAGHGYWALTMIGGAIRHHEASVLTGDAGSLFTPCLAAARCPDCDGRSEALEVPIKAAYPHARIPVSFRCGSCNKAFEARWPLPPGEAYSPRPRPRRR